MIWGGGGKTDDFTGEMRVNKEIVNGGGYSLFQYLGGRER